MEVSAVTTTPASVGHGASALLTKAKSEAPLLAMFGGIGEMFHVPPRHTGSGEDVSDSPYPLMEFSDNCGVFREDPSSLGAVTRT